MNDIDIWRAADLLLKQHGGDAELVAEQRSDALLDQGDPAGSSAWILVGKAIRGTTTPRAATGRAD